jgi:hypothetical protein
MLERYFSCVGTDDAGSEDAASIRARLRDGFTPAFGRRATILGLLIGGVLRKALDRNCEAIVYASAYGETRTLADFLDSFPHASPTLFQTSVHPSAVQQVMIDRQQPVREYIPLAGGRCLAARALVTAILAPAERVVLCGGEERGSWMTEYQMASDRSFAFALALQRSRDASTQGRIRLLPIVESNAATDPISFPAWFELLHGRRNFSGPVSAEWQLELEWT